MQSPQSQLDHFARRYVPDHHRRARVQDEARYTDPFFSDAPTGKIYTDSLLGLKPFYIGPDTGTIGQEFLNALVTESSRRTRRCLANGRTTPCGDIPYRTSEWRPGA